MIIVTMLMSAFGVILGILFLIFILTVFVRIFLIPFNIIARQFGEVSTLFAEVKDRMAHRAWKKSRPREARRFINQQTGRLPEGMPNPNLYSPGWRQIKSLVDEFDAKFVATEKQFGGQTEKQVVGKQNPVPSPKRVRPRLIDCWNSAMDRSARRAAHKKTC